MKPQEKPANEIPGVSGKAKMRMLKTAAKPKKNSERAVNNFLSSFFIKGNKVENNLRKYVRAIIKEELNFFINQYNERKDEIPFIDPEKPPVLIINNYRKLTAKETEVMDLVLLDFNNRKISARLNIKLSTVKNHIKSINKKFGTTDRKSACSLYRKLYNKPGLIVK